MKKSNIILCTMVIFLFSSETMLAQKEAKADPKHQNIYTETKVETDELIIEIIDPNAQMEFSKMKIRITNKTNDYILYKPDETEFVFDFGTVHPKGGNALVNGKNELIEPRGSNSRVITASGDNRFHVESFTINFKGFYRIPAEGKVYPAPDFQLPASSNDFKTGPFKVLMTNVEQKTQQTSVRFKVSYTGDNKHYGFVQQGKVVCKIASGQEYAMVNSKDKTVMLASGEEDKFNVYYQIPAKVVDMQFATMNLVWKDTFIESEIIPMKSETVKMTLDAGKTAGKNK